MAALEGRFLQLHAEQKVQTWYVQDVKAVLAKLGMEHELTVREDACVVPGCVQPRDHLGYSEELKLVGRMPPGNPQTEGESEAGNRQSRDGHLQLLGRSLSGNPRREGASQSRHHGGCSEGLALTCTAVLPAEPGGEGEAHEPKRVCDADLDGEYTLKISMWDAAMFICTDQLGCGANVMTGTLLFINVACQLIFVGIIIRFFWHPELDNQTVLQMANWRARIGHSLEHYDQVSGRSLTQRVCAGEAVGLSTDKATLLIQLRHYWDSEGHNLPLFSGPALCLVCLLGWTLTVFGELREVWSRFGTLILGTPRGPTTVSGSAEEGYEITALSGVRKVYLCSLMAIQATVAGVLLTFGLIFIGYTTSIERLLLHAMALEVIFTIDERFVEALAPARVKGLVKRMKPLKEVLVDWHGADFRSAFLMLAFLVTVVVAYVVMVLQVVSIANGVQGALCGGNQAFVYNVDPIGFPWLMQTRGDEEEAPLSSSVDAVVHFITSHTRDQMLADYSFLATSPYLLRSVVSVVTADFFQQRLNNTTSGSFPLCSDALLPAEALATSRNPIAKDIAQWGPRKYVGEGANGHLSSSCEELKEECKNSNTVRALCPATCGCADPVGGVLSAPVPAVAREPGSTVSTSGCPWSSCYEHGPYHSLVQAAGCTDLIGIDPWQSWGEEFEITLGAASAPPGSSWPCTVGAPRAADSCRTLFAEKKCGIVAWWLRWAHNESGLSPSYISRVDPCSGSWTDSIFLKPLTTACPVTCTCRDVPALGCPSC